jgi:hypothetical protein
MYAWLHEVIFFFDKSLFPEEVDMQAMILLRQISYFADDE